MTKIQKTEEDITEQTNEIRDLLIRKNEAYGDSALNPTRIFSRADACEQIKVRIDDKLSRLANLEEADGKDPFDEDVILDLIGYLVLLRIARKRARDYRGRTLMEAVGNDDREATKPEYGFDYKPTAVPSTDPS